MARLTVVIEGIGFTGEVDSSVSLTATRLQRRTICSQKFGKTVLKMAGRL